MSVCAWQSCVVWACLGDFNEVDASAILQRSPTQVGNMAAWPNWIRHPTTDREILGSSPRVVIFLRFPNPSGDGMLPCNQLWR